MRGLALPLVLLLLVAGLGTAAWLLWPGDRSPDDAGLGGAALASALEALEDEGSGAGIDPERPLRFPADYGPHPTSLAELWDLSGLLEDGDGGRYGLRLTFVRADLSRPGRQRSSALAADTIVAAAVAIAAEEAGRAISGQRASRAALGLAGAAMLPADAGDSDADAALGVAPAAGQGGAAVPDDASAVWVEGWRLTRRRDDSLRLTAATDGGTVELVIEPRKAPVAIGDLDLIDGPGDGEPLFRLYLQPRLTARGQLTFDGERRAVTGEVWLDQAWGALGGLAAGGPGRLALNRFALALDDGTELACTQLRRRSGGGTPIPTCVHIAADGSTRVLRRRDLTLAPVGTPWTSRDGTAYPLRWRLTVPALGLDLSLTPLFQDQQQALVLPIWSGIAVLDGTRGGEAVAGWGRVDLSGYAAPAPNGT